MLKRFKQKSQEVHQYTLRLLRQPTTELTRWQNFLRFSFELARHCTMQLRNNRAEQMAAALTYYTLLSVPPMLIVMFAVFFSFKGMENYREDFKTAIINVAAPSSASQNLDQNNTSETEASQDSTQNTNSNTSSPLENKIEEATTQPTGVDIASDDSTTTLDINADNVVADANQSTSNDTIEEMKRTLDTVFSKFENVNFGAVGLIGLLIFIYGSTRMFVSIENSFNIIYNQKRSRPWYLRMTFYYTCITLAPAVIVGGVLLQRWFMGVLSSGELTGWLAGPLMIFSPIISIWLVIFVMYELLPNANVSFKAAFVGSLVAAVLWFSSKEIYAYYIQTSTSKQSIYGALALIPISLIWIWITWLIVLFGLELSYALQILQSGDVKKLAENKREDFWLEPIWVIPVALQLSRSFEKGEAVSIERLAEHLKLPFYAVTAIIQACEEAKLIHRIDDETQKYCLAKPESKISITDLMRATEKLLPDAQPDRIEHPDWNYTELLKQDLYNTNETITLADLIREEKDKASDS